VLTNHIDDVSAFLDGLDRAGMETRAAQGRGDGKGSTILTVPVGSDPRPLPECATAENGAVNSRSARWRSQRWSRSLLAGLLGILLMVIGPWSPLWAGPPPMRASGPPAIPLSEQPFYPELLAAAARWSDAPLGQVVGESPRETLLNFYAVMARVANELELATRNPQQDPGLFWSPAERQRIDTAQQLFELAVQALDASTFPESVRDDMADEAAMQLKEVLDYVFTHSTVPITIPDSVGLKTLNNQRSQASQNWTLADTAITLTSEASGQEGSTGFVFSAGTVSQVGRMYREINDKPAVQQPFATPDLYSDYICTPGYLAAPKWYLRLPANVRRILETAIDGQTLLQVCAALVILLRWTGFSGQAPSLTSEAGHRP
jgi:MscS family membrane protein